MLNHVFFISLSFRDNVKVNGQMDYSPGPQGAPLSPGRYSNVRKVTGVGGTTYEISV